jgi:hypothetical protein
VCTFARVDEIDRVPSVFHEISCHSSCKDAGFYADGYNSVSIFHDT